MYFTVSLRKVAASFPKCSFYLGVFSICIHSGRHCPWTGGALRQCELEEHWDSVIAALQWVSRVEQFGFLRWPRLCEVNIHRINIWDFSGLAFEDCVPAGTGNSAEAGLTRGATRIDTQGLCQVRGSSGLGGNKQNVILCASLLRENSHTWRSIALDRTTLHSCVLLLGSYIFIWRNP
jgi:hypothetical protein